MSSVASYDDALVSLIANVAENYITITGASRATATRDLQDLVAKGALTRTGERRYTRYWLNLGDPGDFRRKD